MNIFNNLNLNGNKVQYSTLENSKIGTHDTAENNLTANDLGAIKYAGGSLYYCRPGDTEGTFKWQALGDSSPQNNNVNGEFRIYTDNTFTAGTTLTAVVDAVYNSTTSSTNKLKVQGNGKGTLKFTGETISGLTNSAVSTDVVKILYANIEIDSTLATAADTNASGILFYVNHGLDTPNILVNVYFAEAKEGTNTYSQFNLIQCDVFTPYESGHYNSVGINIKGSITVGLIKVVLYGGAQTQITDVNYVINNSDVETNFAGTVVVTDTTSPTQRI